MFGAFLGNLTSRNLKLKGGTCTNGPSSGKPAPIDRAVRVEVERIQYGALPEEGRYAG